MDAYATAIGSGIAAEPEVVVGEVVETADESNQGQRQADPPPLTVEQVGDLDGLAAHLYEALRPLIHAEMQAAVQDVEFRLGQMAELERRARGEGIGKVYVEDIVSGEHRITGYLLTNNSPNAGSIAWSDLHVVFMGVDYTIANGNTANRFAWFIRPASGTSATLQTGNVLPTLGPNDALIFVNNGGVGISALETSIPAAIGPGTVGDGQIVSGGLSRSSVAGLPDLLATIDSDLDRIEALADGAITHHFGPDFPWANGSSQPTSATADVYTVQNSTDETARPNGRSYRWSGPNGSPANEWVLITDTEVSKALADSASAKSTAESKSTTFYSPIGQVPSAIRANDEWVVTDQDNRRRRATAPGTGNWTDVTLGDRGIGTIGGGKVGSGINASNVTTGTLAGGLVGNGINGSNVSTGTVAAARVGAGVNGAVLGTATGTVGQSQIGAGAVTPVKINAPFHLLY